MKGEKVGTRVRLKWMFLFSFRQSKSNISQKSSDQNQRSGNYSKRINIPEIHFSSFLSHKIVSNKNIIAREISNINIKKSYRSSGNAKLDPINGTANHAADKLINKPENAFNHGRYFFLAI